MSAVLALQMFTVALLWGVTNPFLKSGSKGIEKVGADGFLQRIIREIIFLVFNYKYMIPFILNQLGSAVFVLLTLQQGDINVVVPVTNSLTFVITTLVGYLKGEGKLNRDSIIGLILISLGSTCFILNNSST
ncbi:transmembrane protein 234 homolog [Nilaparvata lugens]|uniref:transmembrane protein 234 homolog n=1 Tax=Nilaparvata lugens TaxID=108931 RepID=UPI000B9982BF|nr:transmembrane protein 234 homolog [Nilaparvata lugens]